ncbi:MAG: ABC transporter permease [Dehalococcoidia bacterium]|nr:ABC transporter permease [Dehalococcoidia bacterium]
MLSYIARRLIWTPFLLLIVSLLVFTLGSYGPGDPVEVLLGQRMNQEVAERIRHERGLDRPFWVQYGDYLGKVLRGDLGESFKYPGQPVRPLILQKMWISAQLGIAALAIALAVGLPLGLMAALRQGTWLDTAIVSFTLLFMSLPVFITAPFLILVFALNLDILPTSGWNGLFSSSIVLPALVMGLPGTAVIARLLRASTLDVLGQDYIRTARAKGLPEMLIQRRHVLRNALTPVVTVVGLSLGTLAEGAFITETLFGIPGVGRLALDSIFARDYPIIMAITLIIAASFVAANILVDIAYGFLDPRIRRRAGAGQ